MCKCLFKTGSVILLDDIRGHYLTSIRVDDDINMGHDVGVLIIDKYNDTGFSTKKVGIDHINRYGRLATKADWILYG